MRGLFVYNMIVDVNTAYLPETVDSHSNGLSWRALCVKLQGGNREFFGRRSDSRALYLMLKAPIELPPD